MVNDFNKSLILLKFHYELDTNILCYEHINTKGQHLINIYIFNDLKTKIEKRFILKVEEAVNIQRVELEEESS